MSARLRLGHDRQPRGAERKPQKQVWEKAHKGIKKGVKFQVRRQARSGVRSGQASGQAPHCEAVASSGAGAVGAGSFLPCSGSYWRLFIDYLKVAGDCWSTKPLWRI